MIYRGGGVFLQKTGDVRFINGHIISKFFFKFYKRAKIYLLFKTAKLTLSVASLGKFEEPAKRISPFKNNKIL